MITVPHLEACASRPGPAAPGASPALTPSRPDAGSPPSDRRPGLPPDRGPQNRRSSASARSRVPLRRKRPAGTRGHGDIDEPSVVTGRARWLDHHAASEIDAPGPCLTPTCGGRTRRPRTEEWPLPDNYPRNRCQLGGLDPRTPITEEGLTTVPLPPPRRPVATFFFVRSAPAGTPQNAGVPARFIRIKDMDPKVHFGSFFVSLRPLSLA
jgi:hypothetical protein